MTDAQMHIGTSDEEVVLGLEVDMGCAVLDGALEVLSEDIDEEEDSCALGVKAELLESDEVVWDVELEVQEGKSLLEDV